MKKTIILLMVLMLLITPVTVFSQDLFSFEDEYLENDVQLETLKTYYTGLLDSYEDDIEYYENIRLSKRNIFYYALSQATRDNGLKQVDWNVTAAYAAVKSREFSLSISFRNSYMSLFLIKQAADSAREIWQGADNTYEQSIKNFPLGFVSESDLMQIEYTALSTYYTYLSRERSYLSSLRGFNFSLGKSLDFSDYVFNFDEQIFELKPLSLYLECAVANVKSIVSTNQIIIRYETELMYIQKYNISTNYSYVSEKLELLDINPRLQILILKQIESDLISNIERQYSNLMLEKEKLSLDELNLKILKKEYEINKTLLERGYLEINDLTLFSDIYNDAVRDYAVSVFSYNTQIKSLELYSAFYLKEDD